MPQIRLLNNELGFIDQSNSNIFCGLRDIDCGMLADQVNPTLSPKNRRQH